MPQQVVCLVGLKVNKSILLIIIIFMVTGCTHLFSRGYSREEKIAFDEARKAFQSELKKAAEEGDEIQIFSINFTDNTLTLKKVFKKGDSEYAKLMNGFLEANAFGTVVQEPHNLKIVFLAKNKRVYDFNCNTTDGRIEKKMPGHEKPGRLFLSKETIKLLN